MMEGCRIHVVRPDGRVLDATSDWFELDGRVGDTILLS